MSDQSVIYVEGLSKKYIIGHEVERRGLATLREAVGAGARKTWQRTLDVARGRPMVVGDTTEEFWALKDISFEVKRGEVVGIIGRNGAGKSTLLKILSRITEPTLGRAKIHGRVASLLEVGTGFHPELSGRENVFLNGAILGMTRAEIKRKFDEIVEFAGVSKFIDTPVKRYSSGMHVRLAFAVAAHLEPEILIIDEVLAVGDAEFQRKCLGKIGEVAASGRTVFFVSHNLAAVTALCRKAALLVDGRLDAFGDVEEVVARYSSANAAHLVGDGYLDDVSRQGKGHVFFRRVEFRNATGELIVNPQTGEELRIFLHFEGEIEEKRPARIGIAFFDHFGTPLIICANEASSSQNILVGAGDQVLCRIPRLPLSAGRYTLDLFLEQNGVVEDWLQQCIAVEIQDGSFFGTSRNLPLGWEGKTVLVENQWHSSVIT